MIIIKINHVMVYKFQWNVIDSNSYIVVCKNEAIIIDPIDSEEFIEFVKDMRNSFYRVILTHEHFDHIAGLNKLSNLFSCIVYANSACSESIQNEKKNLSAFSNIMILGSKGDKWKQIMPFVCKAANVVFHDNLTVKWMDYNIVLVSTPGHSPGSICIIIDESIIFTGDSLLADYNVITRLPGGDKRLYQEQTLPFFKQLPNNIMVFPGHGRHKRLADIL